MRSGFEDELCKGFDKKRVISTLIDAGMLIAGSDGNPTQKPRIKALKASVRVYVLRLPLD
jgi:hypothetical protein